MPAHVDQSKHVGYGFGKIHLMTTIFSLPPPHCFGLVQSLDRGEGERET